LTFAGNEEAPLNDVIITDQIPTDVVEPEVVPPVEENSSEDISLQSVGDISEQCDDHDKIINRVTLSGTSSVTVPPNQNISVVVNATAYNGNEKRASTWYQIGSAP
jgi:hypothetical protein